MQTDLSQKILQEYLRLVELIRPLPVEFRIEKTIEGTGGAVSIAYLIAYQIGWGKCLIRWYESGIEEKTPEMPGDGFNKWEYTEIARHFYQKYGYDHYQEQERIFHQVVMRILKIVEIEHKSGNIDKLGVWPWCTLKSGKKWPLSKWIQINTVAPYKKARLMIKKEIKNYSIF